MSVTVYKVGGSLFELPQLAERLCGVLSQRAHTQPLLVAGGAKTADLVRAWDDIHGLGDERAHQLAMDAMALNECLLATLVPHAVRVARLEEARDAWRSGRVPIVAAGDFLRAEEAAASVCLPHSWDATSDAISAWIARTWPADELILLKSIPLPDEPAADLAAAGHVDACFASLAEHIPAVGWINLRDPQWNVQPWPTAAMNPTPI